MQRNSFDLTAKWQALIQKYFPTDTEQARALTTKECPPSFLEDCNILEKETGEAFDRFIESVQQATDFSFNNTFQRSGIDELVQEVASKNGRFMVRSTGKEDTDKLANAGGNTSVPNVQPKAIEILQAMRDIVASYIGKKSLTQRLDAGDASLFELIPFTPILMQRMIGETDPNKLPKCGVMFTEEAEGGIADLQIKDADRKVKTTGITIIQCTYGHNEGVVNNLIPVDTFYVDSNKQIYPIIRFKSHRLIPSATEMRKLELRKNDDPVLVQAPALNKDAVLTLKGFAVSLENFYKKPMDVEFVINEDEKTIYIVQARPIVHIHDASQPGPSYLTDTDSISVANKVLGSAIGVAGGALRWVNSKAEIIIKKTIGEALDYYQDRQSTPDPKKIQCIVIGTLAPSTSREATTFRSERKPVLYCAQWKEAGKLLETEAINIVISPQQGLIVNWSGVERSTQELVDARKATSGWIDYPIPRLLSLNKDFMPGESVSQEALEAMVAAGERRQNVSFKQLFKEMKLGNRESASRALAQFKRLLAGLLGQKRRDVTLDADLKKQIDLVTTYAMHIAQQIEPALAYQSTDNEYMQRLFPITCLESLFYQQRSVGEIVDVGLEEQIHEHPGVTIESLVTTSSDALILEQLEKNIPPNNPVGLSSIIESYLAEVGYEPSIENRFSTGGTNPIRMALANKWVRNAAVRIFHDYTRSFLELVVNACDAMAKPEQSVGKFGMGFFSIFSFLSHQETDGCVINLETCYKDASANNQLRAYKIIFSKKDINAEQVDIAIENIAASMFNGNPGTKITILPRDASKMFSEGTREALREFVHYLDEYPHLKITIDLAGGKIEYAGKETNNREVKVALLPEKLVVTDEGTGIPIKIAITKLLVPSISTKGLTDVSQARKEALNASKIRMPKLVEFKGKKDPERSNLLLEVNGVVVINKQLLNPLSSVDGKVRDLLISMPQVTQLTLARDELAFAPDPKRPDSMSFEEEYLKKMIKKALDEELGQ